MGMGRTAVAREHQTAWDDTREILPRDRDVAFSTASHEILFVEVTAPRCDVCQTPLHAEDDDDHGAGMYVWSRGGDVTREDAPLCKTCSGAIFASALGMIDFDDEE